MGKLRQIGLPVLLVTLCLVNGAAAEEETTGPSEFNPETFDLSQEVDDYGEFGTGCAYLDTSDIEVAPGTEESEPEGVSEPSLLPDSSPEVPEDEVVHTGPPLPKNEQDKPYFANGHWDQGRTNSCITVSVGEANNEILKKAGVPGDIVPELFQCLIDAGHNPYDGITTTYVVILGIAVITGSPELLALEKCKEDLMKEKGVPIDFKTVYIGDTFSSEEEEGDPCDQISDATMNGGSATINLNHPTKGEHEVQVKRIVCGPPGYVTVYDPNGVYMRLDFDGAGNITAQTPQYQDWDWTGAKIQGARTETKNEE